MSTVVIGTAFVDVKGFPMENYDPQGRNLGEVKVMHGGVGRNVAENFANVGMPVEFFGLLEDSAFGKDVKRHLEQIGVGLGFSSVVLHGGIGMWVALFDAAGNLARSVSQMPDVGLLQQHVRARADEAIRAADSVVLEIDLNEQIAQKVIDLAEECGKPVYAVVGNMSVAAARPDLLGRTQCFICNAIEAAKLFGDEAIAGFSSAQMTEWLPKAAESIGIDSMVVTIGEHGAVYCEDGSVGMCPAVATNVVDTTGAGDAFFSGTVMGLIKGMPLSEATTYGARLASDTIGWYQATCPVNPGFFA